MQHAGLQLLTFSTELFEGLIVSVHSHMLELELIIGGSSE